MEELRWRLGLVQRFGAVSMGESPSVYKTLIWDEESSFMIKIPQLIRECDIMKCGLDWSDTTVIKQYIVYISDWFYINGLVQERSYSIANALELCFLALTHRCVGGIDVNCPNVFLQ